ncbi:B-cell linker protein isoform X2 [Hypanus sabinus]|uniref:B-cell linker protein isoform X2 n=1 Tax=Hypanus sabinus TaxID=79690 RepID=UPI0028C4B9DF|nr:B-cell linker protein isoform X2 [Hypanus sabinus]
MATKLPTREECENWRCWELAEYLRLNNLYDAAKVVEKQRISGAIFLNSSDSLHNRFNVIDYPQIQKIVHDIKKNDGGIIRKFKKITKQAPPTVPHRDYTEGAEGPGGEQWSDNEFDNSDYENPDGHSNDSDTYEDPHDDGDVEENYEPPPSEKSKKMIPNFFSMSREEYADNRPGSRPAVPPSKPNPVPNKRKTPPLPHAARKMGQKEDDEGDYIVPMKDNESDDAYIDPKEERAPSPTMKPPVVNRAVKPSNKATGLSSSPKAGYQHTSDQSASEAQLHTESAQDVYEVPDEAESSPPMFRPKPQLPKPGSTGTGSPGLLPRSFPKLATTSEVARKESPLNRKPPILKPGDNEEEYEVCDPEPSDSSGGTEDSRTASIPEMPIPPQRELKLTSRPLPKPRMAEPREHPHPEGNKPKIPEKPRPSHSTAEAPVLPVPRLGPKPHGLRLPPSNHQNIPETAPRHNERHHSSHTTEQDPSVDGKAWYANHCDRKTAEERLQKFSKDGSYLIRKSSGQDTRQPYTLVVLYNKRVYNIPVRYIEATKEYALGKEKIGEERFTSVADIIENHQKNPLVLIDSQNNTKDSTKLKYPVKDS